MQRTQVGDTRLSVNQCVIAIDVLNHDTVKVPPVTADPIVTLMKIARAWQDARCESAGIPPLVVARLDLVYLDRSRGDTIIYSRRKGTYCVGRASDPAWSWAVL